MWLLWTCSLRVLGLTSARPLPPTELDISDSGREGCAVSTLTITSEPKDWRGAVQASAWELDRMLGGSLRCWVAALHQDAMCNKPVFPSSTCLLSSMLSPNRAALTKPPSPLPALLAAHCQPTQAAIQRGCRHTFSCCPLLMVPLFSRSWFQAGCHPGGAPPAALWRDPRRAGAVQDRAAARQVRGKAGLR